MRLAVIVAAASLTVLTHGATAFAADFKLSDPYFFENRISAATVHVKGEILPGDLEKLVDVLSPIEGFDEGFWDGDTVLSLDSPGGNYHEGIEIGRMVREKGIGTRVPAGAECYSACAIIFMHGITKADGDEWLNRRLHPRGLLGFHAPHLVLTDDVVPSRRMVEASYSAAMMSIAALIGSAGNIFSEELLMQMLVTPADEMLMVETVADLLFWKIALDGVSRPLWSLTYDQMIMACQTLEELEREVRPTITAARANEIVSNGYRPEFLGVAENKDEIYRLSVNDMNSVGCNLGAGRNEDGSLRVRYYGTSYGNDPMPQTYSWQLSSLYFMDPSSRFGTR